MKNKRIIGAVIAIIAVAGIFYTVGGQSGGDVRHAKRQIFGAQSYTEQEIGQAMDVVVKAFKKDAKGCKLEAIRYDEEFNKKYASGWKLQYDVKDVIVLLSEFTVDETGGDGSFSPNSRYSEWQWILARTEGGWEILTSGY